MDTYKVDNAIILVSERKEEIVPLTFEKEKEYLEVKGESLLERQIKQLNEVGINDITIAADRDRDCRWPTPSGRRRRRAGPSDSPREAMAA